MDYLSKLYELREIEKEKEVSAFDEDPNEGITISGADFAIMCDELDALREERDRLRDRVAELEDYIQRTPEALGCRYGGECDYKNPAVISKIEADAVRNCASEIADKVANLENDSAQSVWKTFQDWIEQRANQLESGQ